MASRLAEDVRGDDVTLILAGVGQRPDAGDVADRPEAFTGAQASVDGNPVGVGFDADGLEADCVDPWSPARGYEQVAAAQLVAVLEREHELVAVSARGGRVEAESELDAIAAQDLAHRLPERGGLAGKNVLATLDQRDLASEATHGLGHLDPDRTAAKHQHPPGDRLHPGRLAVGPGPLELAQAGHRRHDRIGAGRNDDVVRRVAHAVDLDGARAGEPAAAAQQVDTGVGQPSLLAGVGVVGDHEIAPGERRLDVHLGAGGGLPGGIGRLPRAQQRL